MTARQRMGCVHRSLCARGACGRRREHLLLCLEDPEELRLSVLVLARAQRMRDPLQGIHKRACAVVRGVHLRRPAAPLSQPHGSVQHRQEPLILMGSASVNLFGRKPAWV